MVKIRRFMALFLVALLFTVTACAKKSEQPAPTSSLSLEEVRKQAAAAFDGTTSSAQRRTAAEETMRLLLALLALPESTSIPDQEWAKPPRPGVGPMVRHLDLGAGVHLYALALPGNTLAERRERFVVQVRKSGSAPRADELTLLADSKLQVAKAHKEGSRQLLTLALSLNSGGGYVAHFEAGSDSLFKSAGQAFAGLAGSHGDITLAVNDSFLLVNQEGAGEWTPSFDPKQPLRLMLGPDLMLDWKQRFVVVDDARFDAFALFKIATNPASCKTPENCPEALVEQAAKEPAEAAKAAWQQATAKFAALLQKESTWSDDFAGKLPEGSRSVRGQGTEINVRLLSIPAPQGVTPRVFTAVQFRTGGGLPTARVLSLPGMVESYRVITHEGAPALFLLVDQTTDPKSNLRTKGLHLLRLDAGNDWLPVERWIGSVPNAPHWFLTNSSPGGVNVEWETSKAPNLTVSLGSGAEPAVSICKFAPDCHRLTWFGGRLQAAQIVFAQLTEATQALPVEQLLWRAANVAELLVDIDPGAVSSAQIASFLDPNKALGIQVFDAGASTRLITMPANPTPLRTAVLYAKSQALVVQAYDGLVTQWEGARVVQGGNTQRLLILGRSDKGAVLMTYDWDGTKWVAVDALSEKLDRVLMESVRVMNTPGQTMPVHGLVVLGSPTRITAARLTQSGAEFCENNVACATYGYNNGWELK